MMCEGRRWSGNAATQILALFGERGLWAGAENYPVTTRVQKFANCVERSREFDSVRDRGVVGSNPIAPTKSCRRLAGFPSGIPAIRVYGRCGNWGEVGLRGSGIT